MPSFLKCHSLVSHFHMVTPSSSILLVIPYFMPRKFTQALWENLHNIQDLRGGLCVVLHLYFLLYNVINECYREPKLETFKKVCLLNTISELGAWILIIYA